MNHTEITEKLSTIFKDVFKTNLELKESVSPKDIDSWDSLNHMILIKKIEEAFQFEMDLFDVIEIKNVGDIIQTIRKNINN